MTTDHSHPKFGEILHPSQNPLRDAVHVACVAVKANGSLKPGQHVGVKDGVAHQHLTHIGVIDPFLKENVRAGELCWLFLYPGTITSLRHCWTHPSFPEEAVAASPNVDSVRFLEQLAERRGQSYAELMELLEEGRTTGSGYGGDDDCADMLNEDVARIYQHYTAVTGLTLVGDTPYFRCAC